MNEPDPRLVRAAAAGDEAAFAALVRAGQPHVWRFARHLLGDPDAAADVTQETFVRVYRSLHRFRFESRYTTWLFRIARNAAVDEQRRAARRPRPVDTEPARPDAGDASLGAEVRAALATLPVRLREPFVLVEVFGMRYHEVAEVLGMPTGTVKSRVHRARRELVRWFSGEELRPGGEHEA